MEETLDIFEHLDRMREFIGKGAWSALEDSFAQLCGNLAGANQTQRIASLPFPAYESALRTALQAAVERPAAAKALALYFEYDLDVGWESWFFFCGTYNPECNNDDEWACEWLDDPAGPSFAEASEIYRENFFDRTPTAIGSTLYLVARTVAAFGRCCDAVYVPQQAVCIGFHDQSTVFRIREPGR